MGFLWRYIGVVVLFLASAAATHCPSSAEAGRVVCSTPDGSRSLLSFFIPSDNNDADYNDRGSNDKYDKILCLSKLKKLCACFAERTRRHRHTACQQTGRERTVQEETNRPEPRVQEEHTRGGKIRFSQTCTNTQTRIRPAVLLAIIVCLTVSSVSVLLFITAAMIIY